MDTGESSASKTPEEEDVPLGKKKPLKVRCVLLYDGTGNNKTNINSRLNDTEGHYKKSKSLWNTIIGGNDSYDNFFTNIASLDTYTEDQSAEGFDITVKIYTEGIGTRTNEADERIGLGTGTWVAGVKAKCNKGINEAINVILNSQFKGAKLSSEKYYLEQLHFDVYGFSRGAAAARYAVYKLMLEEDRTIKDRMRLLGFDVKEAKVRFVGLFDTVSSHGLNFNNDVGKLHLDAIKEADSVVHLCAGDEHRKNFSLTTIKSAGAKGLEYYMPGVHSDIGGSYHDQDEPERSGETFVLHSGHPEEVKFDARQLIAEGWYQLNDSIQEILYEESVDEYGRVTHAKTKANREAISNAYCRIPLKVMAEESKRQQVPINYAQLTTESEDIINQYQDLQILDQNIRQYLVKSMEQYNRYDPLFVKIRNKHLHMSAKKKLGMGPRFEGKSPYRRRVRLIHEG